MTMSVVLSEFGVGPECLVGSDVDGAVEVLGEAVGRFASVDLDALTAHEQLALVRRVEVLRRRVDLIESAITATSETRPTDGPEPPDQEPWHADDRGRAPRAGRTGQAPRQQPLRRADDLRPALPSDPSRLATRDDVALLGAELRVEMRDLTSQQTRTLMLGIVLSITGLAITHIVIAVLG